MSTETEAFPPGVVRTHSGRLVNLLAPQPDTIDIDDIAHHLSHMPRWIGGTKYLLTVAEHSVRVSRALPAEKRLAGLMHDASEYLLGDMATPVKLLLPAYLELENRLMLCIADKFGFAWPMCEQLHAADRVVLGFEYEHAIDGDYRGWQPEWARQQFLQSFYSLHTNTTT